MNVKRLTKLSFDHVSSFFKPFGPIYVDITDDFLRWAEPEVQMGFFLEKKL